MLTQHLKGNVLTFLKKGNISLHRKPFFSIGHNYSKMIEEQDQQLQQVLQKIRKGIDENAIDKYSAQKPFDLQKIYHYDKTYFKAIQNLEGRKKYMYSWFFISLGTYAYTTGLETLVPLLVLAFTIKKQKKYEGYEKTTVKAVKIHNFKNGTVDLITMDDRYRMVSISDIKLLSIQQGIFDDIDKERNDTYTINIQVESGFYNKNTEQLQLYFNPMTTLDENVDFLIRILQGRKNEVQALEKFTKNGETDEEIHMYLMYPK